MIVLQVIQSWCKDYYPEHYQYRVAVYREGGAYLNTGKNCESKVETVAFVEGLELAFRTMDHDCKVEFVAVDGETADYNAYFFPEDRHE